ncbi:MULTISPECIES: hypothetical protein [unclassified Acinetobacter]|uniref:hypothetical protein n=1 Tax=unclassified Acinetobacter TaxID=196816 RepID=UPI0015D36870|nr:MULTISPECIES: hypothetical protein [unclassified Acinetobacter]
MSNKDILNSLELDNPEYRNEQNIPMVEPFIPEELTPDFIKAGVKDFQFTGTIESIVNIQDIDQIETEYAILYQDDKGDYKIYASNDLSETLTGLVNNSSDENLLKGETFSIEVKDDQLISFVHDGQELVIDSKLEEQQNIFLSNYSSNEKLNKAVIEQMGGFKAFAENAPEIANNGIDGGFTGFTYHEDTLKFAQDNRELILDAMKETVDNSGWYESVPEMMGKWTDLKGFSENEIAEALYSNDENHEAHTSVYNAMAWYAGTTASHEFVSAIDEIQTELMPLRPSDENLDLADKIEDFANKNDYSAKVTVDEENITIEISNKSDSVLVFLNQDSENMVYSDDKFGEREIDSNSTNPEKDIFNAVNDGLGFNKDNLYSANFELNGEEQRVVEKSLSIALDTFQHYEKNNDLKGELNVFSDGMDDRTISFSRQDGEQSLTFNKDDFSKQEVDFLQSYAESRSIKINDGLEMGKEVKQESKGMELD